jgi:hypothetical protein
MCKVIAMSGLAEHWLPVRSGLRRALTSQTKSIR